MNRNRKGGIRGNQNEKTIDITSQSHEFDFDKTNKTDNRTIISHIYKTNDLNKSS